MNVLWVCLVPFPPLCRKLGKPVPSYCGWLYSSARKLIEYMPHLKLGVVVYSYGKNLEIYEVEGIKYYLLPSKKMSKTDSKQISCCKKVLGDFNPNLIHIHGTEYSLAQAICIANDNRCRTLVNIQGLAGPYTRYADGALSLKDKILNITPLDFYRSTFLLNVKKSFNQRAECERYVINNVTDIVGRTQWDHDHVLAINPKLNYHFMNETLRDSFYEAPKWSLDNCVKHRIFVSNSCSPLKGAHQVVKALPIILRDYPDAKVCFCGSQVMSNKISDIIHFQGYHLYLRRLVKKMHLEDHVEFLGLLSESQMKQAFLDSHVYVMPSSIENSPNSLCEAQILGVPVVASYCGGTSTLVNDKHTGFLYRYEEYEMMAYLIMKLFSQKDLSLLSAHERQVALKRHDRSINAECLKDIYNLILV